jgi:hypothetical protein
MMKSIERAPARRALLVATGGQLACGVGSAIGANQ